MTNIHSHYHKLKFVVMLCNSIQVHMQCLTNILMDNIYQTFNNKRDWVSNKRVWIFCKNDPPWEHPLIYANCIDQLVLKYGMSSQAGASMTTLFSALTSINPRRILGLYFNWRTSDNDSAII